jgi:predicted enzyme related to lactoylglutathione lyase
MPDATVHHAQGTPCWLDMFARDQAAALAYYRDRFGWVGTPNTEFGGYAVVELDGRAVAGISPVMPGMPDQPVTWNTYFAVDDAASAAQLITKHGGTIFAGPDEVPGTGVMVFAADPSGAPFGLWEAKPFPGFQAQGEPGTPGWFELETHEGKACADFYAAVLGIDAPEMAEMPGAYWLLTVGGDMVAGIWHDPDAQAASRPARWNPYFVVADTDAAVSDAVGAGASVVSEAKDSPYGRFSKLRDPQGAEYTVIKPPARS